MVEFDSTQQQRERTVEPEEDIGNHPVFSRGAGRRGQDQEDPPGRRQRRPGDDHLQGRHHRRRRRQARRHPGQGPARHRTTCNVFRLLKACGLPVAFEEQDSPTSFIAPQCAMLPYEVVVRREAHGSYLKRNPHFAKGQLFPQLIVEFYLKTKDKDWKGKPLVADDPLMEYAEGASQIRLFNPAKPLLGRSRSSSCRPPSVLASTEEWKILPRDAADRAPRLPGAREGLAARGRHAGRSQGRVRLRRQGHACCSPT